jgi:uncharacterized membrane protein
MGNNIARSTNGTHSIVNYSLFVGIWWLFTLLYFLPTSFIDKFSIPIVDIAMDALSVLFGFCAAVAMAAYLGAHSCSNYVRSITSMFRGFVLMVDRTTHTPTASAIARATRSKTAGKHRLHAPSCGSAGLRLSPRSC